MLRARFPLVCLTSAMLAAPVIGAPCAYAQSAPASSSVSARINDIQIAHEGDTISILIKLSQQPAAAAVKTSGEAMTVEVDGLSLVPLNLAPPPGSLVTKVEATSGKLTLSGAAFSSATTVIYRNAVLIEAKLAEPDLHAGASLMTAATPIKPQPVSAPPPPRAAPAPIAPVPVAHPAPVPVVAAAKPPAAHDELLSHLEPAAPAPPPKKATPASTASLAGIDAARCTAAATELAKDAWALAAMGDHALCLLDADKLDEAKSRIDQLAAITPQDWRVALGRAVLEEKSGASEKAQADYVSASLAAPNDTIRAAIAARIAPVIDKPTAQTDLQLPLPTKLAASH